MDGHNLLHFHPEVSESHDSFSLFVAGAEEKGSFCLRFHLIFSRCCNFFNESWTGLKACSGKKRWS